jgi:hypothetical protein
MRAISAAEPQLGPISRGEKAIVRHARPDEVGRARRDLVVRQPDQLDARLRGDGALQAVEEARRLQDRTHRDLDAPRKIGPGARRGKDHHQAIDLGRRQRTAVGAPPETLDELGAGPSSPVALTDGKWIV